MISKIIVWPWLILCLVLSNQVAFSQAEADPLIEQIIEDISEDLPEDFDFSDLNERLNFYHKNPLDINKVTGEQLQELFFLSPVQINAFLEYRTGNGKLLDVHELQTIDGFDLVTVGRLVNFIYIGLPNSLESISLKSLYQHGANDLMIRYSQYLQKQKGYQLSPGSENTAYIGTPQRLLLRYRYNYGQNVSASLNMEKDAGEQLFPGNKSLGFDFSSANIFVKNLGLVKKLVLGDYSLQFGQGLTLWSGLSFGKGAMITSIAKPELGLQPYRSSNEVLFLRGIASSITYKSIQLTPFLSIRKMDGGLEISGDDSLEIASMSQTGLHRTSTELLNKNTVSQTIYGANIRYTKNNLNAGFTGYQTRFDHPIQAGQYLYNKFKFSGDLLTNLGFNYGFTHKNSYLFGEAAYSGGNKVAFINGLMASISSRVSVVILHRNYPQDYHSFFNQAISEASNSVNENGLYVGLLIKPASKFDVSIYSDYFRFPWLKFGVDAPSMGYELFGQLNYSPSKNTKWAIRYKLEQKQDNDEEDNAINVLQDVRKQSYRFEFSSKITELFTIRNRVELSDYKRELKKRELGWMAYQDIIFKPMQSRYSGNLRLAFFNTPGFNSRIYAYENDVLYSYSVPAYQNQGIRFYLNGRYSLSGKMDLWFRYSLSKYNSIDIIGSGNDQIAGSKRSEIKLQLRYLF
jgi:hypothetical protein